MNQNVHRDKQSSPGLHPTGPKGIKKKPGGKLVTITESVSGRAQPRMVMDQTPHLAPGKMTKGEQKPKKDVVTGSPDINKNLNKVVDQTSAKQVGSNSADTEPGELQNQSGQF